MVLSKIISIEQGVFIPSRNIGDSILLATKVHHLVLVSTIASPSIIIKLDMEKAFDKVS